MALSSKLLQLFKSEMPLEQIAIKDTESEGQNPTVSEDNAKPSKITGHLSPYIKINGYVFDHHDIESFRLSENNMLPTIDVTIRDIKGIFKSAYFPKSNPILSLYIRSKHESVKPIRCDFLITSITSDSSIDPENHMTGKNMTLVMRGALFVPTIYNNQPQSFNNMTSLEVLQQMASDMRLGFTTNEEYTDDKMTWIKPLVRRSNFLQHVVNYAFKDDQSFYYGFVDRYYNFTFINMGGMFNEDLDFDKMFQKILDYSDLRTNESDTAVDNTPLDFFLTNFNRMATMQDFYLRGYRPETVGGALLAKNGYIRNIGYYDQQLTTNYKENFVDLDVKPISDTLAPKKNAPDELLDEFAANSNGEWCGIDYNNGHANFNFAQIQNEHNNQNIRKITLNVKMNGVNLNLVRGQRVPVLLFTHTRMEMLQQEAEIFDENAPVEDKEKINALDLVKDKWLSGYYVVGNITYTYEHDEKEPFSTEATLLRMNWDQPEATVPNTPSAPSR